MPWTYPELPASIQLPPCPHCTNRGRVSQIARHTYACTDCQPPRVFVAIWQAERPALANDQAMEQRAG